MTPAQPRRWRVRLVVGEVRANLWAWRALVVPIAVVVLLVGGVVAWQSTTSASDAHALAADLDARGRYLLQVDGQGEAELTARYCDGLGALGGVVASAGIASGDPVHLANGDRSAVRLVTPGMMQLLGVRERAEAHVGASRAELAGLVDGAWLALAPDDAEGPETAHRVAVLPATPRTERLDDAIVLTVPPSSQPISTCWVETEPGATGTVAAAIGNVGPDGQAVTVAPLVPEVAGRTDPEDRLRSLPGDATTLMGGAASGALLLAWWYIRRQEWALYRSLGFPVARLGWMALGEWLGVVAVPLVAGVAWGIVAHGGDGGVDAARVGVVNGAVMVLVSAVAVPLWVVWIRRVAVARTLRGV